MAAAWPSPCRQPPTLSPTECARGIAGTPTYSMEQGESFFTRATRAQSAIRMPAIALLIRQPSAFSDQLEADLPSSSMTSTLDDPHRGRNRRAPPPGHHPLTIFTPGSGLGRCVSGRSSSIQHPTTMIAFTITA
jgi:hypothetical protein